MIETNKCAYCGSTGPLVRVEHPIPQCLWEGPRPAGTVTVPVCDGCEKRFQKHEEYIRNVIVAMAGDQHPETHALLNGGAMARGWKKYPHTVKQIASGVTNSPRFDESRQMFVLDPAFEIDVPRFNGCVEKMVRGLYYHVRRVPLGPEAHFTVWPGNSFWAEPAFQRLLSSMHYADFGDSVFACRYVIDSANPRLTRWLLTFYGVVCIYACTDPAPVQP